MALKLGDGSMGERRPPTPGTPTYQLTLRDEAIARAVASGFDRDKLMAYYELTPAGLATVLPRIAGLVTAYRERFQIASQMNQLFVEQLAPKALDNIELLMDQRDHKEWGLTNRWVIEQARGSKLAVEGGLSLNVSPEAIGLIGNALKQLADTKAAIAPLIDIDNDPHFVDGKG